jgi:uncharacterized protein with beta-barrel porin domain
MCAKTILILVAISSAGVALSQAISLTPNQAAVARALESSCASSAGVLNSGGTLAGDQLEFFRNCTSVISDPFKVPPIP